jgi:hypothetical protein
MRSIGPKEIRRVEAPEASGPDLTGMTVPQVSPSDIKSEGAELAAGDRDG